MNFENVFIKSEQITDSKCDLLENIVTKIKQENNDRQQNFEETIDAVEEFRGENSICEELIVKKEYENDSEEYSHSSYDEKTTNDQHQLDDTDSPLQPNQCPECHHIFKSETCFKKHKCRYSKSVCNVCQKTFTEISLKAHRKIHDDVRKFLCIECDKTFLRSSDLTRHLRTHTGDKKFVCNFCGKKFIQKGHLNDHVRIHTGEKPYKCDLCHYKSNNSSSLNRHKKTHTEKLHKYRSNGQLHRCPLHFKFRLIEQYRIKIQKSNVT